MSRFHQLSAGKSSLPLKSSFNVTAEVVGAGDGDGVGVGVGDGDGDVVAAGVGLTGVDPLLPHAITIARPMLSAPQRNTRGIIDSLGEESSL
jgi:hypothetical protein